MLYIVKSYIRIFLFFSGVLVLTGCGGSQSSGNNLANTPLPSSAPSAEPSAEPAVTPSLEPSAPPTEIATPVPTPPISSEPTLEPTLKPTVRPTVSPSEEPNPTPEPTAEPTPVNDPCDSTSAVYTKPCWTSFVGIVDDTEPPVWAKWQRSWLTTMTGFSLIDAPERVDLLIEKVTTRLQRGDILLPIPGYSRNDERMAKYLDFIHNGGVATWQEAVALQVSSLANLNSGTGKIYYQLGNEITVESMSEALRNWASSRTVDIAGQAQAYDPYSIPFYVEYYLAPTVSAARKASQQIYGDPNRVQIILGSLGDGGTTEAKSWLDKLLNYEAEGTFANDMAGVKVYDMVQTVSVHYIGSTTNLQPIWDDWVGVSTILNLWTTEEIGSRSALSGEGAARAARTLADQLHWFYSNNLSPEQSRVAFYDWNVDGPQADTSAATSVDDLFAFLGHTPLMTNLQIIDSVDLDFSLTQVRLEPSLQTDRQALVYWPADSDQSRVITQFALSFTGWTADVEITVHHYSPSGVTREMHTVSLDNGQTDLILDQAIHLDGRGHAILITAQHNN